MKVTFWVIFLKEIFQKSKDINKKRRMTWETETSGITWEINDQGFQDDSYATNLGKGESKLE